MSGQTLKLPDDMGFFIFDPTGDALTKKENRLSNYDPLTLDKTSLFSYYLTQSSIELYSGRDSSVHLFRKAYEQNEYVACRIMRGLHNSYLADIDSGQKDKGFSWYLWDLPNFDEIKFLNGCDRILGPTQDLQLRDTSLIEKTITYRDRKYRAKLSAGDIDFLAQGQLDLQNRWYMDSLYRAAPDLTHYDKYELEAFYLVVHHSGDCDWVYRWVLRLLDNIELHPDLYIPPIVGPMLDRMLQSEEGYCTTLSWKTRDRFIELVQDRYPDLYEQFDFDRFSTK
jgi:hypothetical protein